MAYIYTMNNTQHTTAMNNAQTTTAMFRFTITMIDENSRVHLMECTTADERRAVASEIANHYADKTEFISVSEHIVNGEKTAIIHNTNGRVTMIFRER